MMRRRVVFRRQLNVGPAGGAPLAIPMPGPGAYASNIPYQDAKPAGRRVLFAAVCRWLRRRHAK